eukprot:TRINITY_DN1758_c0_g1_i1.p1 TRINITY_DN1758_c0_g1~~TRINITY_DN1758_c0_g1_i1.p1  ORF type:complete len:576 (-),score=244.13 TRINITY_DN1758_c0_g1_i1:114-1841(-)
MDKLDIYSAIKTYFNKIFDATPGMKALLLDEETIIILSSVFAKSDILKKEVYLFEKMDNAKPREKMPHLKSIVVIRPTPNAIELLEQELKDPKYSEYSIYFTNILSYDYLRRLAQADIYELVIGVQEFYADYFAITNELFSLNIPSIAGWQTDTSIVKRISDGLISCCLSLKRRPLIRFQSNSEISRRVAKQVTDCMRLESSWFNFRQQSNPILLIIDRVNDPITPLLMQWTYQAMVHELIGIVNCRVNMRHIPGVRKELEEIILSFEQDKFYAENMFSNFGELAINVKKLVDDFQQQTKKNQTIESIADMKRFVEDYPEFRKLSNNVSKHVTILDHMSSIITRRDLMNLAEFEQDLACNNDFNKHTNNLYQYLQNPLAIDEDKIRLLIIYALRYEQQANRINEFKALISSEPGKLDVIDSFLRICGSRNRCGDLFANKTFFANIRKSVQRGLQGVQNIFSQHKPLSSELIDDLANGKLSLEEYPYTEQIPDDRRAQEIIVFFVGGTTFEEAVHIHNSNINSIQQNLPTTSSIRNSLPRPIIPHKVIIGGSTILNSKSFIDELGAIDRMSKTRTN